MLKTCVDIEEAVIRLITKLMEDLGYDLDEPIVPDAAFVRDLGFASLDFVQMIVLIEESFGQKLGFQALLLKDGTYVKDLKVGELVSFISRQLEAPSTESFHVSSEDLLISQTATLNPLGNIISPAEKITAEKVAQFRLTIRPRQICKNSSEAKNSRAIFVLCPPRSGSTLLRVILAGHPQLFSPPELYLLMYKNLAQRRRELANDANSHLLEGTVRAIMQLKGCSAEEAEHFMEEYEASGMRTKQFYGLLQEWLGDRILVDKTPLYPLDLNILKQAEEDFVEPLYIYLTRHPYGAIHSYEESKLDRFVPALYENCFHRRELAELTWLISNQNITRFLKDIPQQRWLQVKFEELVNQPSKIVGHLCDFLSIDFNPSMLNPYEDRQHRMLEGTRQVTRMPGDLKFHLHKGIDANTADRWKQFFSEDFIGDTTRQVAESLGYSPLDIPQTNLS
jgi:acyl carrier protein